MRPFTLWCSYHSIILHSVIITTILLIQWNNPQGCELDVNNWLELCRNILKPQAGFEFMLQDI